MHLGFFQILIGLAGASSLQALAVEPGGPRTLYKIQNWETGLFMDRRPGNEVYGYPVAGFPFTVENTQKWHYVFNSTRGSVPQFLIGGGWDDYVDVQYINTDDGKTPTLAYSPALFELFPVKHEHAGPAYILRLANAELAITARQEHSAPLTLTKLDPHNPLQHWRFYVPTF